jgi:predicted metal-dependent HD superfamily phosphohydrolase
MSQPDFIRARAYILEKMSNGLARNLFYHGLHHTIGDVAPAVERLAEMEGINGEALLLLNTAALYHDSGFLEQYTANEAIGTRIASQVLPKFRYTDAQIQVVGEIIMATQVPQRPQNLLQEIMCDGDLDTLGREDFFFTGHLLRLELAAHGQPMTVREWHTEQLAFLEEHRYFTSSAQSLRNVQKQKNIRELRRILGPAKT